MLYLNIFQTYPYLEQEFSNKLISNMKLIINAFSEIIENIKNEKKKIESLILNDEKLINNISLLYQNFEDNIIYKETELIEIIKLDEFLQKLNKM
jgi:hypothetical protein